MAQYKITFFMRINTNGFTESWYYNGDKTINDLLIDAQGYFEKRAPLCGTQTINEYIRISSIGVTPRQIFVAPVGPGANAPQVVNPPESDFADTALLLRCYNSTLTRYKFLYLRGVLDSVVARGGRYIPTGNFSQDLGNFKEKIKANTYGWLGQSATTSAAVDTIIEQANGQVLITTLSDFFTVATPPKTQVVRITRATGCTSLNGVALTVLPGGVRTALTIRRIPIFTYQGFARISVATKAQIGFDNASVIRVVERRAGRPSYQSRGRRAVAQR